MRRFWFMIAVTACALAASPLFSVLVYAGPDKGGPP